MIKNYLKYAVSGRQAQTNSVSRRGTGADEFDMASKDQEPFDPMFGLGELPPQYNGLARFGAVVDNCQPTLRVDLPARQSPPPPVPDDPSEASPEYMSGFIAAQRNMPRRATSEVTFEYLRGYLHGRAISRQQKHQATRQAG